MTALARRDWIRLLPLALWVIFGVLAAQAEEEDTESALQEIQAKVQEQEGRLGQLAEQQLHLEAELAALRQAADATRGQERQLQQRFAEKTAEKESVQRELQNAERESRQIREFSRQRMRALFIHRTQVVVQRLMMLQDASRLSVNAFLLSRLAEFDRGVLAQLAGMQAEQSRRQAELEQILKEQTALKKELRSRSEELASKTKRQEVLVKEIRLQKSSTQETLVQLRAQALRLETVVASLTGAPAEAEERQSREHGAAAGVSAGSYDGSGLKSMKGKLPAPVRGTVVQRFGTQRSTEFKDLVASKGLDFQTETNAPVSAVAPGRVLFLGKMPGFGLVIIVDHGARWYSLYGRLGSVGVQAGDTVEASQEIAASGEPDQKGRSFYFEIRENGHPVNPSQFIKNL